MLVLVTRPAREAALTADRLRNAGFTPVLSPVLSIEGLSATLPTTRFDAVLVTSANVFEVQGPMPPNTPLYVVGNSTATAAARHGWRTPAGIARDSVALAALLLAAFPNRAKFLYLAGKDRKSDIETRLRAAGHSIEVVEVYEARAVDTLSSAAIAALNGDVPISLLHFSRRSAAIFMSLLESAGLLRQGAAATHVCLSLDVAMPLAKLANARILCAEHPNEDALIQVLTCANHSPGKGER